MNSDKQTYNSANKNLSKQSYILLTKHLFNKNIALTMLIYIYINFSSVCQFVRRSFSPLPADQPWQENTKWKLITPERSTLYS